MLYLLDVHQIDRNNFQERISQVNKRNSSASAVQTSLTRTPGRQTAQIEPPRLPRVGSHVGEVPGAVTETAGRNGPGTVLQTIWNDLPDETIRKYVLSFCKPLMALCQCSTFD